MKRILFTLILTIVSPFLAAFDLNNLQKQLQHPVVQGKFTQKRYLKSLDKPLQTSGRFVLQQSQGLLWYVEQPLKLQLRIRADGIAQYHPQQNRWINTQQGKQNTQMKLFMAVFSGNTQELTKQFDIQLQGSAQSWKLLLTPKTLIIKQIFQHISISGGNMVQQIELHEKQGEKTLITFHQHSTKPNPQDQQAWQ